MKYANGTVLMAVSEKEITFVVKLVNEKQRRHNIAYEGTAFLL